MKYLKRFNEAKIFGRKLDRDKFTKIEDMKSEFEEKMPILRKAFQETKSVLQSLLSAFKKVYEIHINDKIDFAIDKLSNYTPFSERDTPNMYKKLIKKTTDSDTRKFIIDFWTEFVDIIPSLSEAKINEYNFIEIASIFWKYRTGIHGNNQEEINKCFNEILHLFHKEWVDSFLHDGIKVGEITADLFEKDFDGIMDKYQRRYKDVKFAVDEDDNIVIFYVSK